MKRSLLYILLALVLTGCNFFHPPVDNPNNGTDTTTITPLDTTNKDTTIVTPPDTLQPPTGLDPSKRNLEYLFDIEAVPEITLTVTEANWNQYLQNFDSDPNNGLYIPAAFTFTKGENSFHRDSVGLRPRGNTSRRRPEGEIGQMHDKHNAAWHHAHFGIKFTEYVTGERFFGMDRVVLKWHNNDPCYCREVFCYDLFQRFGVWSAPRASYCKLSIYIEGDSKPAYFGVYEMIEGVRKGWTDDRQKRGLLPTETPRGNIWKAVWGADLSNPWASMGTDNCIYTLKNNEENFQQAEKELRNFIQGLRSLQDGTNSTKNWLEQHIDVDLFLRAMAVNVAVGMWDDYWINNNNYYFYFDGSGKFYFIPYDYDNTLGTSGCNINAGTQNPLYWGSRGDDRMLIRRVLSVKEYEDRYKAYLKEIVTNPEYMETNAAMARVRKFQNLVRPYVPNDTGEDMEIYDAPAGWANCPFYRLLSGNDKGGEQGEANFFKTKAKAINDMR